MPSCFSSLLLAMSLGVLPAPATAEAAAPLEVAATPPVMGHTRTLAKTSAKAPAEGKAKGQPKGQARATAKPPFKGNVRTARGVGGKPPAAKAGKADCDTPAATAELARPVPVPVPADPLAPTLKPCAEPARTP